MLKFSKALTTTRHHSTVHRAHRRASSTNASANKFLVGKTAIITGSTSGIGLGFAQAFAKSGANIVLNGFGSPEDIRRAEKEVAAHGVKVHYSAADMSKPEQISAMVQEAKGKFGSVDILINNAGIQHVSPVAEFPDQKWDQIMAINLSAVFHGIKAVIPIMQQQKWGRIINVASVHGLVGSVNKAAYVAAKHGVVGLTKVVALELAGSGVTANCINPGWTLTPLVEAQIQAKAKERHISIEQATRELLEEKQPSKQFVSIEQLAGTGLFLCSPAADQITGTSIVVDGAWTAQ